MTTNSEQALPQIHWLRTRLRPIFEQYGIQRAVLFGSLATGRGTRHSDLDLILIQETSRRFLERSEGILRDITRAVPGRDVDLLIYTPEELDKLRDRPFICHALRDGKVLYEYREESLSG